MGWQKLFRRKLVDQNEGKTELHRVLSAFDLTLLGIGSTLGTGIYVLAGDVAKTAAGPAVVISFLVAALASVLAGLCYAEFGARVPKAGSAYVYSYVCVGEVIAFVVGWNLIMEYVIGVASVSKAYSGYVDSIIPNNAMSEAFKEIGTIHVSFLAPYFDFFAFGITLILTFLLLFGVKESTLFNNVFTVLNLLVVLFVIIAGAIQANSNYWDIDATNPVECKNFTDGKREEGETGDIGSGGFAPFGIAGIMSGAATCFYGFIGFDVIATTGEEAKNPKRSIPISIVLSLLFIFMAYFGISTVLTMMVPFYCQDRQAPLPYAFQYTGFEAGKWVVNVGALFGLATSLLGSMFPMPRIIYSMARDGLLFKFLAYVHPYFQTPMWSTLIGGLLGAIMGAVFELSTLIDMMSIGTLTAYTVVAVCVLILRYRKDVNGADDILFAEPEPPITSSRLLGQIVNAGGSSVPTKLSSVYSLVAAFLYCITCFALCGTVIVAEKRGGLHTLDIILIAIFGLIMLLFLVSLQLQPVSKLKLSFTVPIVPWIPAASVLVNTYLILELPWQTWVRFAIWMAIGLIIYVFCLCTGLADKTYSAIAAEHASTLQKDTSKSVYQGVDNPALEYTDEKEDDKGPRKQEEEDKPSLFKYESANMTKVNGTVAQNGLQKSEPVDTVGSATHGEAAPPRVMINSEPIEMIDASDNYASDSDIDPEAYRKEAERLVDMIIEWADKHTAPEDQESPNDDEMAQKTEDPLLHQHYVIQDCLNGKEPRCKPLLNSPEDLEAAQEIVRAALTNAKADSPPAPSPSESAPIPADFIAKTNQIHKEASTMLGPAMSIEKIHGICQKALDGDSHYQVYTSSPSERTETQEFLQNFLENPNNYAQPEESKGAPATNGESVDRTVEIHEVAQKILRPEEDPLQVIHRICQDCLDNVNNNNPKPILPYSHSASEMKKLVESIISDSNNSNQPPAPPPMSPEATARIGQMHHAVQAVLNDENEDSMEKKAAESLLLIHQISQMCLNGVSVASIPWLKPILASEQDREAIKKLNRSITEPLLKELATPTAVDPNPEPTEVPHQRRQDLERIHGIAQEALVNIANDLVVPDDNDDGYAEPDVVIAQPEAKNFLSPSTAAEPLYAVVNKKPKLPKISVTFEDKTEILTTPSPEPDYESVKQKLKQRRPTGVFDRSLMKFDIDDDDEDEDEANEKGRNGDEYESSEATEEDEDTHAGESENSGNSVNEEVPEVPQEVNDDPKTNQEAQPVVTRKKSLQKSVGDLISLFENASR